MERKEKLYTTGEISRICKVTKRTIRYYEQIGMIKPYVIDEKNSYRYYDPSVLKVIQQIRYLFATGFSIGEIKGLIENLNMEELKNHLLKKSMDLEYSIKIETKKYMALKFWYGQCVRGKNYRLNNYENNIEIEYIPLKEYIFYEGEGDCSSYMERVKTEACLFASFNDDKHNMRESIGELCYIFESAVDRVDMKKSGWIAAQALQEVIEEYSNTRTYGGTLAICGYHAGSYDNIGETYRKLFLWGERHDFQLRGDSMEKQIVEHYMTSDEKEFVTKIYLPVCDDSSDEELEYNLNCR